METGRLSFLEIRDGKEAAIDFASRTLKVYRTSVLRSRKRGFKSPHHASSPGYRRGFILSYLSFRRYLREQGKAFLPSSTIL